MQNNFFGNSVNINQENILLSDLAHHPSHSVADQWDASTYPPVSLELYTAQVVYLERKIYKSEENRGRFCQGFLFVN